jgi:hypothetical protein
MFRAMAYSATAVLQIRNLQPTKQVHADKEIIKTKTYARHD